MNAAEARRRRGGSTLVERVKRDRDRAIRIDSLVAAASVESVIQAVMKSENVSAAELARRVNVRPPQISRDIHGGFSKATMTRLVAIAEALGCDFVPAFVPRSDKERRRRFFQAYDDLIRDEPPMAVAKATRARIGGIKKKAKHSKPVTRKVA